MSTSSQGLTIFLMTEKGYRFLRETTVRYGHLYRLIVVGGDASVQNDYQAEIIAHCRTHGLRYVKRVDFQKIETEYAMAISWRWLIQHPADKLVVFHDSLLPRYRGFAPLPNALINGETEVGVTALLGADEYDRGGIITQSRSTITYPIKIAEAIEIIERNYREAAEFVLERLSRGEFLQAYPQNETEATYSVWRDEEDYRIDWNQAAAEIIRFVNAVGYPYKGASAKMGERLVRITDVEEVPDVKIELRHVGKVLFIRDGKPIVICGSGLLKICCCTLDGADCLPLNKFRVRFS